MIEPLHGPGVSRARAECDGCGFAEVVACGYRAGNHGASEPDFGQVVHKLVGAGWEHVKGRLLCRACKGKRKVKMAKPSTIKEPGRRASDAPPAPLPPAPSARMVSDIVAMLDLSYDTKRKRYKSPKDSDKTVAGAIGPECRWGWVSRIREAEFGPDTRAAETDTVRSEIAALGKRLDDAASMVREVDVKLTALRSRIDALV